MFTVPQLCLLSTYNNAMWVESCKQVPCIPALLEIANWAGSEIKIMQLNKYINTESPGNGATKKIRGVLRETVILGSCQGCFIGDAQAEPLWRADIQDDVKV